MQSEFGALVSGYGKRIADSAVEGCPGAIVWETDSRRIELVLPSPDTANVGLLQAYEYNHNDDVHIYSRYLFTDNEIVGSGVGEFPTSLLVRLKPGEFDILMQTQMILNRRTDLEQDRENFVSALMSVEFAF